MAVFPDRIVLKNSTDAETAIVSAIQAGGSDEITQGEIVLGLTSTQVKFYTKAGDGSIVSLGGTGTGSVTTLAGLSDVNILSPLPQDGDVLAYDSSSNLWIAADPFADVDLGDLGGVDLSVPATDGQYLAYEAASLSWKPVDFDIAVDTSPTLGGDLNAGTFEISSSGELSLAPSSGELVVKGGSSEGRLTLNCTANSHGVSIQSPPHSAAATYTLTLPTTSGTPGQALITTDGSGVLEWSTITGAGTVISVDGEGENGITVTGGPITAAGTLNISLDDTSVAPGTYTAATITVDQQGRITNAWSSDIDLDDLGDVNLSTPPEDDQVLSYDAEAGEWVARSVGGTGTVTSVDAQGNQGITVTGAPITSAGTLDITLDSTAVTPGEYKLGSFTVDQQGRLTAASQNPMTTNGDMLFQFAGNPNRLAPGTEGQALTMVSGYPAWTDLGVGGTVSSVDIIGGAGISSTGGPITTTGSITIGLEANGVTPGQYTNATVTVDATGRVVAVSSGEEGSSGIEEAPNDGQQYARQSESWSVVVPGGVTSIIAGSGISVDQNVGDVTITATGGGGGGIEEAPQDGSPYARQDAGWVPAPTGGGGGGIEEAPEDGTPYARQDATWVPVPAGGGGSGAGIYLSETQVASGGTADFVGLGYSGILQKVTSDLDAWIVLYSSAAERIADAGRAYNADPAPGSGVLFEAYVTAGGTIVATPGTTYLNNDATLTEAVYAAVRDQAGTAVDASVTFSAYGLAAITAVNGGTFGSGV